MNKILVTIYVLSIGNQYDMLIPINIYVNEALELIQNGIVDLVGEEYLINEKLYLCSNNIQQITYNKK